ncbi:MAG: hypothetical protein WB441_01465 [Nocardioidaceae bacterium]
MSAPALWGAFVAGSTTAETAMTRFFVSALLCWAGLAVVSLLVGPAPRSRTAAEAVAATDDSTATTDADPAQVAA